MKDSLTPSLMERMRPGGAETKQTNQTTEQLSMNKTRPTENIGGGGEEGEKPDINKTRTTLTASHAETIAKQINV